MKRGEIWTLRDEGYAGKALPVIIVQSVSPKPYELHEQKIVTVTPAFTMLKSIESGAAGSWALSNLVPRMLAGDFKPGFFVKHFIKDMNIALESAKELGIRLPGLEKARQLYQTLAAMSRDQIVQAARIAGLGKPGAGGLPAESGPGGITGSGADLGTQAIILLYAAGRFIAENR